MYSVILAAGRSKRIGRDKAFLKIKKRNFIDIIINKLKRISDDIIIVAGKHNYKKLKKHTNYTVLLNSKYQLGQINSLKIAIKHIRNKAMAIILHLVDQPLIKQKTYKKLLLYYRKNTNKIIIPKVKVRIDGITRYKRGHPIIIPKNYFNLILKAPYDKGLHWVIHNKKAKIKEVIVKDKMILKDIDTKKDFIEIIKKKLI